MKFPAIVLLALLASACGGDDNNPFSGSSTSSLNGTWSGSTVGSAVTPAGIGQIRVTLAQTGARLSGTWSVTFTQSVYNNAGTLTGSTSGTAVSLTLDPSIPTSCPYAVTGTRQGAGVIIGTYATFNCSGVSSGPLTLTRQ